MIYRPQVFVQLPGAAGVFCPLTGYAIELVVQPEHRNPSGSVRQTAQENIAKLQRQIVEIESRQQRQAAYMSASSAYRSAMKLMSDAEGLNSDNLFEAASATAQNGLNQATPCCP